MLDGTMVDDGRRYGTQLETTKGRTRRSRLQTTRGALEGVEEESRAAARRDELRLDAQDDGVGSARCPSGQRRRCSL